MSEQNQLAERPANSVKEYLALPAYRDRFHEVMGKRAPQFMAAIVSLSQTPNLREADPKSVIGAAMTAATLDLPVNPTLGMAHVVAYADNTGRKVAQFQLGYKGLIQLAQRSGQYKRLNAGAVNAEVFGGYDIVGEPMLDWTQFDPTKEVAGYFCAFETLNGFQKVVYWTKAQVEAHAKRFSKAYAKGFRSSPWFTDFDSMATKTVIKAALTKWGIMSVEMQKIATHDQAVVKDVDAEPEFVDNAENVTGTGDAPADVPPTPAPERPTPPARAKKGAAKVAENAAPAIDVPATPVAEDTAKAHAAAQALKDEPAAPELPMEQAAPEKPKVRAFLADGEAHECVVIVDKVDGLIANIAQSDGTKKPTPSVKVSAKGGYLGEFYHFGGGEMDGDKVKPLAMWNPGMHVKVTLFGKLNKTSGKVQVRVTSAAPEPTPATEDVEG